MLSGNRLQSPESKLLQSLGKKRCTCAVNAMGYFLSSRSDTTKTIARKDKKIRKTTRNVEQSVLGLNALKFAK